MFSLAYYDGTIEAIPIANGVYDTPHFTIPSPNGRSGTAQFNLPQPQTRNIDIPQPHELHPPRKLGTHFYVVLRGEEVGIYGCWYVSGLHLTSCFDPTLLGTKQQLGHALWLALTTARRATPGRKLLNAIQLLT